MPGPDPIYLDHHATTPVDPRVLEAMLPYFTERFGNPASRSHPYGWAADEAVISARRQVAELLGARPKEIVFTSGATESNNLALKGAAAEHPGGHLITVVTEHKAVLDPARSLERAGHPVTWLEPGPDGLISAADVEAALRPETFLVSVMQANNEVGVIQPLAEIGALCADRGVLLHTDATQGVPWLPLDVEEAGVSLASLSAHKMYGPKGVGALYVRRRPKAALRAQIEGGGHERGLRSGTLNVPGVIGLGAACALTLAEREDAAARAAALRDHLLERLRAPIPDLVVHGSLERRLPNNLSVGLPHVEAEQLLVRLSGKVSCSSGSACTSATLEPSHVLRALGVPHDLAHCSLRLGLGRQTTREEIDAAADAMVAQAAKLRAESPLSAR